MDPKLIANRVRGSYLGLLIADSLSMPVHWYYNPGHIQRDYGRITTFQPPKAAHPSSIMQLSNTGGAGRGAQTGSIIGDVINHGKKQFWGVPNMHYHQGMRAGENTLNALVARLLVRTMVGLPGATAAAGAEGVAPAPFAATPAAALQGRAYTAEPFLAAYVPFMTTPGSHNDTYAETYHRMFFKNMVAGKAPSACADDDKHNVDSAGGLVLLPPPALLAAAAASSASAEAAAAAARAAATAQMYATHNSQRLAGFVGVYADALAAVLTSTLPPGDALRQATAAAGKRLGVDIAKLVRDTPGQGRDTEVIGGTFTSACYIDGSLPSLLYLANKYADSPREALIANTNVGGENCHRVRGGACPVLVQLVHSTCFSIFASPRHPTTRA